MINLKQVFDLVSKTRVEAMQKGSQYVRSEEKATSFSSLFGKALTLPQKLSEQLKIHISLAYQVRWE